MIISYTESILKTKMIKKNINEIIEEIQSDKHAKACCEIRELVESGKKDEAGERKKKLPAFSTSIFENDVRSNKNFISAPLMVFDIDSIQSKIDEIHTKLSEEDFVYMLFNSPSGAGLKFICAFDEAITDAELYKKIYCYLKERFENLLDVKLDNTHDPARLCYLSHSKVIVREDEIIVLAELIKDLPEETKPIKQDLPQSNHIHDADSINEGDGKTLLNLLGKLKEKNIILPYEEWFKCGAILARYLGESALHSFVDYSLHVKADDDEKKITEDYLGWVAKPLYDLGIGTFVKICSDYGIFLKEKIEKVWGVSSDSLVIDEYKLKCFIEKRGICRLDIAGSCLMTVRIQDGIIKQFSKDLIFNLIYEHYEKAGIDTIIDEKEDDSGTVRKFKVVHLLKALTKKLKKSAIDSIEVQLRIIPYNPHRSQLGQASFFFQNNNCVVDMTEVKDNLALQSILGQKQLWLAQISEKNFTYSEAIGDFEKFVYMITQQKAKRSDQIEVDFEDRRFIRIRQIIGYLIVNNFDPKFSRIVVLMDLNIANGLRIGGGGGSGKGLIAEALSHVRSVLTVDGKSYSPKLAFAHQTMNLHSQIVHISDAVQNFDCEAMYNYCTDSMEIEKKYQNRIIIPKSLLPKFLISSNYAVVKDSSSSTRRRFIEFCLGNYFDADYTPFDQFGRLFFGSDWNESDWNELLSFFMRCVAEYLESGVSHEENSPSVLYQKLSSVVFCPPFLDWLFGSCTSEQFLTTCRIRTGIKYDKALLFADFQAFSRKYHYLDQPKFTVYLKSYATIFGLQPRETHSGSVNYFELFENDDEKRNSKNAKPEDYPSIEIKNASDDPFEQ